MPSVKFFIKKKFEKLFQVFPPTRLYIVPKSNSCDARDIVDIFSFFPNFLEKKRKRCSSSGLLFTSIEIKLNFWFRRSISAPTFKVTEPPLGATAVIWSVHHRKVRTAFEAQLAIRLDSLRGHTVLGAFAIDESICWPDTRLENDSRAN